MTFPRDTCPHTIDAGAWLLHALPDEDGERFAAHLASGCLACRAEVEDLRLVVDVLPSAVAQVPPPPALKGRLMSVVRAEAELLQATGPEADRPVRAAAAGRPRRERGRWWGLLLRPPVAVALACALLALGIGGGLLAASGTDGPSPRVVDAAVTGQGSGRLVITDGDQGALELADMPPAPGPDVYQVWLKRPGRDPEPSRTVFDVRPDGRATVRIAEPLDGVEAVLVTAEPDADSPAPTSVPVIASYLS
jgi:hypothetical protein